MLLVNGSHMPKYAEPQSFLVAKFSFTEKRQQEITELKNMWEKIDADIKHNQQNKVEQEEEKLPTMEELLKLLPPEIHDIFNVSEAARQDKRTPEERLSHHTQMISTEELEHHSDSPIIVVIKE